MPRRPRHDKPGRLHHVLNRGQDRQRIFRRDEDYRFFLALLVCAVRAGRIRVHAYCLMPNHYHLLVESVDGDISSTMQWIQGRYGSYFNACHAHTGHTFTGRFHSFPVRSWTYFWILVRYIDRNPWVANRRVDPIHFSWGSAMHHARAGPRPRWLARNLIDGYVMSRLKRGEARDAAYRTVFQLYSPGPLSRAFVEARVRGAAHARDDLDALLAAGPEELATWLLGRVDANTGPAPPLAMMDVRSIRLALAQEMSASPEVKLKTRSGQSRSPWLMVELGLLRDLAGLTNVEAAEAAGVRESVVRYRIGVHRRAMQESSAYLRLVASTLGRALRVAFGGEVRALIRSVRSAQGGAGP